MPFDPSKTARDFLFLLQVERTAELTLWDAWVFAAAEASRALGAWRDARGAQVEVAYVVYCAALDREERAADVLCDCVARRRSIQARALIAA